jgi:hypothetical protein
MGQVDVAEFGIGLAAAVALDAFVLPGDGCGTISLAVALHRTGH